MLLPNTDDRIEHEDEQDDERLDERLEALVLLEEGEDKGEGGGAKQDLDEQVVKLLQHQLPQRRALLLLEFVGAVLGPELLDLRRAQALGECDVVRGEHSVRVLRPAWRHLSFDGVRRALCLHRFLPSGRARLAFFSTEEAPRVATRENFVSYIPSVDRHSDVTPINGRIAVSSTKVWCGRFTY